MVPTVNAFVDVQFFEKFERKFEFYSKLKNFGLTVRVCFLPRDFFKLIIQFLREFVVQFALQK
jgi:hypothetical protein